VLSRRLDATHSTCLVRSPSKHYQNRFYCHMINRAHTIRRKYQGHCFSAANSAKLRSAICEIPQCLTDWLTDNSSANKCDDYNASNIPTALFPGMWPQFWCLGLEAVSRCSTASARSHLGVGMPRPHLGLKFRRPWSRSRPGLNCQRLGLGLQGLGFASVSTKKASWLFPTQSNPKLQCINMEILLIIAC